MIGRLLAIAQELIETSPTWKIGMIFLFAGTITFWALMIRDSAPTGPNQNSLIAQLYHINKPPWPVHIEKVQQENSVQATQDQKNSFEEMGIETATVESGRLPDLEIAPNIYVQESNGEKSSSLPLQGQLVQLIATATNQRSEGQTMLSSEDRVKQMPPKQVMNMW